MEAVPFRRHADWKRPGTPIPPIAMTTVSTRSLAPLLAGYLTGSIDDEAMSRFDDLFVDTSATAEERLAFAGFYLDAARSGQTANALPDPSEVAGILTAARA